MIESSTFVNNHLCTALVTENEVPQKEGKKRLTMGIELLLAGLLILLVLGLLVAFVYSMVFILPAGARTNDTRAKDSAGQQRLFTASILNFINQK